MNLFLLSVFALCLNGVVGMPEIYRYEILPAVASKPNTTAPLGAVTSVTPYQGRIYMESADVELPLYYEVFPSYYNGTFLCKGTPLGNVSAAAIRTGPSNHTTTRSKSVIRIVDFDAKVNSTTVGKQSLCVRLSVRSDINKSTTALEMVSYFDTAFDLNVASSSGFSTTFDQKVHLAALKGNKESGTIGKIVAVDSFLCGEDNVTAYGIGQSFSLCLDASSAYNITSVKNVVCENSGSKRQLVDSAGKKDVFTSFNRAVGIKSNDNKKTGSRGSYRINSVVTAGYFSNKATSFSCTGEAAVVTYPTLRRSLTTSVSFPSFGQKSSFRDLQESTLPESSNELSETPFSTIVGIFEPDDLDIMEASAFFHGYVGLGSSFVAGAAMIMIAAM
mmetsp:Transcript_868/g.1637  ORF Transcript_868/g.1637 Transcript_868/m.1637 type:complete len:389 (-) Transcript_868:168-1334(-)